MEDLKTYQDVADLMIISNSMKKAYVAYMTERWPEKELANVRFGYAQEWAHRFKSYIAYKSSDSTGQAILDRMRYKE